MRHRKGSRTSGFATLGFVLVSITLGLALAGPASALQERQDKNERQKKKVLDLSEQTAKIVSWEKSWKKAFEQIFGNDEAAMRNGLDAAGILFADLRQDRDKITFVELRLRMERIEEEMQAEWPKFKWKLLERLQREGLLILTNMTSLYKKKQYQEVRTMREEQLKPLAEKMIGIDEDFIVLADDLLAQGNALYEDAEVGLIISALGLKVVGIVISGRSGEKYALILNPKEKPPDESAPKDWKPSPRKYTEGQSIVQVDGVFIQKIHRNKVEAVWMERYRIDLDIQE